MALCEDEKNRTIKAKVVEDNENGKRQTIEGWGNELCNWIVCV